LPMQFLALVLDWTVFKDTYEVHKLVKTCQKCKKKRPM